MFAVNPILLCSPKSGLKRSATFKKAAEYGGHRKQQVALPSGCDTEKTWRYSMHYLSRFLSRFRSENSHGEGITQERRGSNSRPQTL